MSNPYILIRLSDKDNFIVGKIVSETDVEIILEYPIVISLMSNVSGTTSVATTKFMPFSIHNKVAIMKARIVAMSKPNEKIVGYYNSFIEKFAKVYDGVLENDILGMNIEATEENEVAEGGEDNVLTFKIPSGNTVH